MNTPLELTDFLQAYEKYVLEVLTPTKNELDSLFNRWLDAKWSASTANNASLPTRSPICTVNSRVKRPESVVDKINLDRLNVFPGKLCTKSLRTMNDTVAGRIIVYFLSDIPLIHDAIMSDENLRVSEKNPPTAYFPLELVKRLNVANVVTKPKESGYNAIHYVVKLKNSVVDSEQRPWIEIQLKTLTEHVWAEIEHLLGYKPETNPSEVIKQQFQIISKHLCAIDDHFNLLCDDMKRAQKEKKYTEKDILNPENLAAVLNDVGLGCAQKEVGRILKIFESREIRHVKEILELATPERLTVIKETYRSELNTSPENSEIVANLVAIKGITDHSQMVSAVRTQINFHKAWETLKGER